MAASAAVTNRPWHFSSITQQKFIAHLSLCCWSTGEQQWYRNPGSIRPCPCSNLEGPIGLPWGRRDHSEKRHIHCLHHACSHFISKSCFYSHAWKYSPWLYTRAGSTSWHPFHPLRGSMRFSGGCCLYHTNLAGSLCDHPKLS